MQIGISLILFLGFTIEFDAEHVPSKLIYIAIIMIIAKCNYHVKALFSYMYQSSQNTLKDFI